MAVISCYLVNIDSSGASYVKVVDTRPILSATEMSFRESSFWQ